MLTNKHGLGILLRGIMEKRVVEVREVSLYTFKGLYNAFKGVAIAISQVDLGWTLRFLFFALLMATIAYGGVASTGVRFGDKVRVKRGFYKDCIGIAYEVVGDSIRIKDPHCTGNLVSPRDLLIEGVDLEVVK
jgi:hypothetical protein